MQKIAVIGDSHYYALKSGWRQISRSCPAVEVTFFGAPKPEFPNYAVGNNTLVATSDLLREHLRESSGQNCIPGNFDCYVFSAPFVYISYVLEQDRQPGDLLENTVRYFNRDIAMVFLRKLRWCTDAPILFLASPLQPSDYDEAFRETSPQDLKRFSDTFHAACSRLAASVKAHYIPQPGDTIADNLVTTRMKFANRVRNDGRVDRWHTNAEFGALVMTDVVCEALRLISESRIDRQANAETLADEG